MPWALLLACGLATLDSVKGDERALSEERSALARCFGPSSQARGCISLEAVIAPGGRVRHVTVRGLLDAPSRRCMMTTVKRRRFEPAPAERQITIPINCMANRGAE
jgi:hypothetical protein